MNAKTATGGREIALVSDLHLRSADEAGIREATDFFEACIGRFAELYILGDLFDCWLGHTSDFAADDPMQRFFRALKAAGQSMPVFLMRGNHDFMVGRGFAREHSCRLLSATTRELVVGGRRLLLLHGHTLGSNDMGLQWLHRLFIASRICPWILAQLSFRTRTKIGDMFMSNSTEHRPDPKLKTRVQAVDGTVRQLCQRHRCDLMIHGHFHWAAEHSIECSQGAVTRICMGFWREDKSGEIVVVEDSGRAHLLQWRDWLGRGGKRSVGSSKTAAADAEIAEAAHS